MPAVGQVGGAAAQDRGVVGLHVGVRAEHRGDPAGQDAGPSRPSRSWPRRACRRGSRRLARSPARRPALRRSSNGLRDGSRYRLPSRLITATGVPSRAGTTDQPRPGSAVEVGWRAARCAARARGTRRRRARAKVWLPSVIASAPAANSRSASRAGDAVAVGDVLAVDHDQIELELLAQPRAPAVRRPRGRDDRRRLRRRGCARCAEAECVWPGAGSTEISTLSPPFEMYCARSRLEHGRRRGDGADAGAPVLDLCADLQRRLSIRALVEDHVGDRDHHRRVAGRLDRDRDAEPTGVAVDHVGRERDDLPVDRGVASVPAPGADVDGVRAAVRDVVADAAAAVAEDVAPQRVEQVGVRLTPDGIERERAAARDRVIRDRVDAVDPDRHEAARAIPRARAPAEPADRRAAAS